MSGFGSDLSQIGFGTARQVFGFSHVQQFFDEKPLKPFPETTQGDWSDDSKIQKVFVKYRDRKLGLNSALTGVSRKNPGATSLKEQREKEPTANTGGDGKKNPEHPSATTARRLVHPGVYHDRGGFGSGLAGSRPEEDYSLPESLYMEDSYLASNLCFVDGPAAATGTNTTATADDDDDATPTHDSADSTPKGTLGAFFSQLKQNKELGTTNNVVEASFEELRSVDQEALSLFNGSKTGTSAETPFLFDSVDELLVFLERRLEESKQFHLVKTISMNLSNPSGRSPKAPSKIWPNRSAPWEEHLRFRFYPLNYPASSWQKSRDQIAGLISETGKWRSAPGDDECRPWAKLENIRTLLLLRLLDHWYHVRLSAFDGQAGNYSDDLRCRVPVAFVLSMYRSLAWVCNATTAKSNRLMSLVESAYFNGAEKGQQDEPLLRKGEQAEAIAFLDGFSGPNREFSFARQRVFTTERASKFARVFLAGAALNAQVDALTVYIENHQRFTAKEIIALMPSPTMLVQWCFSIPMLQMLLRFNNGSLIFDCFGRENSLDLAKFILENSGQCCFNEACRGDVVRFLMKTRDIKLDPEDSCKQLVDLLAKGRTKEFKAQWLNVEPLLATEEDSSLAELFSEDQRVRLWSLASTLGRDACQTLHQLLKGKTDGLKIDTPLGQLERLDPPEVSSEVAILEWRLFEAGLSPDEEIIEAVTGQEGHKTCYLIEKLTETICDSHQKVKAREYALEKCTVLLAAGATVPAGLVGKVIEKYHNGKIAVRGHIKQLVEFVTKITLCTSSSSLTDDELNAVALLALELCEEELLEITLSLGATSLSFDAVLKEVTNHTYKDFKSIGELLISYGGVQASAQKLKTAVKGLAAKNKTELLEKLVKPPAKLLNRAKIDSRGRPLTFSWKIVRKSREMHGGGRLVGHSWVPSPTGLLSYYYRLEKVAENAAPAAADQMQMEEPGNDQRDDSNSRQKRGREDE